MTKISTLIQRRPYLATTISYLITVAISRLVVKAIEMKLNIPFLGYDFIGDYHIHHFAYGIILISLITFYTLYNKAPKWIKYVYLLYGIFPPPRRRHNLRDLSFSHSVLLSNKSRG